MNALIFWNFSDQREREKKEENLLSLSISTLKALKLRQKYKVTYWLQIYAKKIPTNFQPPYSNLYRLENKFMTLLKTCDFIHENDSFDQEYQTADSKIHHRRAKERTILNVSHGVFKSTRRAGLYTLIADDLYVSRRSKYTSDHWKWAIAELLALSGDPILTRVI